MVTTVTVTILTNKNPLNHPTKGMIRGQATKVNMFAIFIPDAR